MPNSGAKRRGERALYRVAWTLVVLLAVVALPSCVGNGSGFPEIVSMTVSPSSIPVSDTGMTDETVDVSITVSGFTGQITEADAFIQLTGDTRVAQKQDFQVTGNTIELLGIKKTWFNNLQPGTYSIGASVVSDAGEDITQSDLTTVAITP